MRRWASAEAAFFRTKCTCRTRPREPASRIPDACAHWWCAEAGRACQAAAGGAARQAEKVRDNILPRSWLPRRGTPSCSSGRSPSTTASRPTSQVAPPSPNSMFASPADVCAPAAETGRARHRGCALQVMLHRGCVAGLSGVVRAARSAARFGSQVSPVTSASGTVLGARAGGCPFSADCPARGTARQAALTRVLPGGR